MSEKFNSIIVLFHRLEKDQKTNETVLSQESKLRVEKGVELFKEGRGNKIILTGGPGIIHRAGRIYEATDISQYMLPDSKMPCDYMMDYAKELGVTGADILTERYSMDTVGEIYFVTQEYLVPFGWMRNIFVTSRYHVWRASQIASQIMGPDFFNVFDLSVKRTENDDNPVVLEKEQKSYEIFYRDFVKSGIKPGDWKAIEKVLFEKHALYSKLPEKWRKRYYKT